MSKLKTIQKIYPLSSQSRKKTREHKILKQALKTKQEKTQKNGLQEVKVTIRVRILF